MQFTNSFNKVFLHPCLKKHNTIDIMVSVVICLFRIKRIGVILNILQAVQSSNVPPIHLKHCPLSLSKISQLAIIAGELAAKYNRANSSAVSPIKQNDDYFRTVLDQC